jgi:hypothetical protein
LLKDSPVTEGAKMTKQLLGIIPLLTACTLDMELSLEVVFSGDTPDLFEGDDSEESGSVDPADFEDYDDADDDDQADDEERYCDVELYNIQADPNGLFLQWEMNGDREDTMIVALFFDFNSDGEIDTNDEVIHVDYVDPDISESFIAFDMFVGSPGMFMVSVSSGEDLSNSLCSSEEYFYMDPADFNHDMDGDGIPDNDMDGDGIPDHDDNDMNGDGIPDHNDIDGDGIPDDEENRLSSCEEAQNYYAIYDVMHGDDVLIDWDPQMFGDDVLETILYTDASDPFGPDSSFEGIDNQGVYELNAERFELNFWFAWGEYNFTLMSPEGCLHYMIMVHPNI